MPFFALMLDGQIVGGVSTSMTAEEVLADPQFAGIADAVLPAYCTAVPVDPEDPTGTMTTVITLGEPPP